MAPLTQTGSNAGRRRDGVEDLREHGFGELVVHLWGVANRETQAHTHT